MNLRLNCLRKDLCRHASWSILKFVLLLCAKHNLGTVTILIVTVIILQKDSFILRVQCHWLVSWLVVLSGYYFSLHRAVSQRGRKKREKTNERKMSEQPPTAHTASAKGPCPIISKLVGRPGTEGLPSTFAPPDHLNAILYPKVAVGMTNSVEPDQTAPFGAV